MVILFSPTGFLEIAIFFLAIIAFALAVRFFVDSRKRLQEAFPGLIGGGSCKALPFDVDRSGFILPKSAGKPAEKSRRVFPQPVAASSDATKDEIKALRTQIQRQQQELSKALEQISLVSQRSTLDDRSSLLLEEQKRLEVLRSQLAQKDTEIQRLRHQEMVSQKVQERFEELQVDFEELQAKLQQMEKQSWQAAELSLQLEHAEQLQLQLEKSLQKKEDKLRELALENQRLQDAYNDLEERFSHTNLQRQQLLRKVQFLEDATSDMQKMAESSYKLKTEITRVAELESMLALMTEERDALRYKR